MSQCNKEWLVDLHSPCDHELNLLQGDTGMKILKHKYQIGKGSVYDSREGFSSSSIT